jgi:hypothetical protein
MANLGRGTPEAMARSALRVRALRARVRGEVAESVVHAAAAVVARSVGSGVVAGALLGR